MTMLSSALESAKATRINLFSLATPQMRTFHLTWFAFFLCFFGWFGIAPLMAVVRDDLLLSKAQIGNTIIASVAITIIARLIFGWLCDRIGPRLAYSWLLAVGSIPVMCIGFANSYETFLLFRLAIGVIGASFVITQYHTSVMFAPNVVGTANATTAGWGNLGGGKAVVDEVLGDQFAGVLVRNFYAAYHHYDGPKQRCWAHLLRDIHDLPALYPDDDRYDDRLAQWADAIHQLYRQATAFTHPSEQQRPEQQRRTAQLALEQRLLALCRTYQDDPSAAPTRLCRRMENHIKELFLFVAEPEVPPDNNAAERSLRPVVISRKISGGSRSAAGTDTKMTLASIFGTWRVQGFNPLTACRQLLTSSQA